MKLTHAQIEAGRSDAGGFNLAQLKALGFPLPARGWPASGWPKQLMQMEVSAAQYAEFLSLRGSKKERIQRATPELFHNMLDGKSVDDAREAASKAATRWSDDAAAFANELFEKTGRDLS